MKLKRFLAVALAGALAFCATACGGGGSSEVQSGNKGSGDSL